jgi:hypothetical protein
MHEFIRIILENADTLRLMRIYLSRETASIPNEIVRLGSRHAGPHRGFELGEAASA